MAKSNYDLFGCKTCKYRMYSQPGCMKFSLTKNEINNSYFVHTIDDGNFNLSDEKPCPYAIGNTKRNSR